MELTINGTAKEIAALVVALQERQRPGFVPETADGPCSGPMVEAFTTSSGDS